MQQTTNKDQLTPRLDALKRDLVNRIPCETPQARQTLQGKHFTDVLITYLTWQARSIRPQSREVLIWRDVAGSSHYGIYKDAIARIQQEFESGQDMNAYVSNYARSRAYSGDRSPPASMPSQGWLKALW